MARCELTHLARAPIDLELAAAQHRTCEQALRGLGCEVVSLAADPDLPDSVFVEDAALVFDDVAIVTRPGAASRRPETEALAPVLAQYRRVSFIAPPGTLDGGDVLRVGRRVFVGISGRSNESGIEQLGAIMWPYGYTVSGVPVRGCLHLKSAVTEVGPSTLLMNRAWVDAGLFRPATIIDVDPAEPHAANGLLVGGALIYPASFPRTQERLERAGVRVVTVDVSELQKAEGAVTCCCLIVAPPPGEEDPR
jgi:dimethylargininase